MPVYFIQGQRTGCIKIGHSESPTLRLEAIKTTCPEPIKLLFCLNGSLRLEQKIQRKFKEQHLHGEWFKNEGELAEFILNPRRLFVRKKPHIPLPKRVPITFTVPREIHDKLKVAKNGEIPVQITAIAEYGIELALAELEKKP